MYSAMFFFRRFPSKIGIPRYLPHLVGKLTLRRRDLPENDATGRALPSTLQREGQEQLWDYEQEYEYVYAEIQRYVLDLPPSLTL